MAKTLDNDYVHPVPEQSYSRELDSRVQATELPYGYTENPPEHQKVHMDKLRK